jgi:hypothetical protein
MVISKDQPLNSVWIKASLIGSLWASVEIVFGSFLHNLKIPFSGTILTSISVFILISFFQVWKEKGMIWRAGLICAIMKSISPSAVILGPMIGILTEAILLEILIRISGSNLVSYMIGGALAVLSALFHKVIMLLILYGFNLVKLVEELYFFILKQVNLPGINPWYLIWIIMIIHLVLGFIAAISGYYSAKKLLSGNKDNENYLALPDQTASMELLYPLSTRYYSLFHLFIIITGTIFCLAFINFFPLLPAVIISITFITYLLVRYKQIGRKFRKPSIWIQFSIIIICTSILLKGSSGEIKFVTQGFFVGLKMILRAIIIIFGFSGLSIEIRNPVVRNFLNRKGFINVYRSLTIAFTILPALMSAYNDSRKNHRKNKRNIESLIAISVNHYKYLERENEKPRGELVISET